MSSFLDRKLLHQCLDLAKRRVAKVDADNSDQLSQRQEAARDRLQREREAKLHSAPQSLSTIEQAKKHSQAKPAHVSISDPELALCVTKTERLRPATTSS